MEARSKHTYASKKVAMRLVFSIDERTELGTTGRGCLTAATMSAPRS
jgi:hypothetical protein